jgi:hypothetical protein
VTDHITSELEKLTLHEQYNGNDQIRATNGEGIDIAHVGASVLPSSTHTLPLMNILHVLRAHKNLVAIHRFTLYNNTFIELHPFIILIKDQAMRKVLLQGPCRGGFYPLPSLSSHAQKVILSTIKASSTWWHCEKLSGPFLGLIVMSH